ncbi:MAG: DUF1003 domain-containing protein [Clostridia bacterium]|nr:DUF1003 domain-containing protein [Clostridia bacterium]
MKEKEIKKPERKKTKKEIVKMLLNNGTMNEVEDENELLDALIDNPIAIDVDKEELKNLKTGDRIADKVTEGAGSWTFIICFILFLIIWILLNLFVIKVDAFPFILLNLMLSCIAALQAPVILMSQNRQAKKDSLRNQNDFRIDLKSELILEELHDKMEKILENQRKIIRELDKEKIENNEIND